MRLMIPRSLLYACAVMAVGLLLAYGLLTGKAGPVPEPPPHQQLQQVDVISVEPAVHQLDVTTQGTVRPLREIDLVSRVAGRVEAVAEEFAEGAFFRADDLLLRIEDVDYRHAIVRAQAQLAAAQQQLAEEEGRALQARREWSDLGSDQANALFLREPQLASAKAAVAAAQADLEAAERDFARTRILAPFNGRVSEKLVDNGQYVTPGTRVARVYATDAALLHLPLTDRQVALLELPLFARVGNSAVAPAPAVTLSATVGNRSWQWRGQVVRTAASIDPDSRVLYAIVEVAAPFAREPDSERPPLMPGLFVRATIAGRPLAQVVALPRSALRSDGSVMVVSARQRVSARPVRVLYREGDRVWLQGLQRGERVIVSDTSLVAPGVDVVAREAARVGGKGD